jgi:hypothetical protein
MARMTLHEKAMQLFFNAQVYRDAGWAFGPFQASDLLSYQRAAASNRLGIPFIAVGDTIHGYKTSATRRSRAWPPRGTCSSSWAVADMQRRESVAVGYLRHAVAAGGGGHQGAVPAHPGGVRRGRGSGGGHGARAGGRPAGRAGDQPEARS